MPYATIANTAYRWWKQKMSSFKGLLDRRNSSHMDSVVIKIMIVIRISSNCDSKSVSRKP